MVKKITYLSIVFSLAFVFVTNAQLSREIAFSTHLTNFQEYRNAIRVLNKVDTLSLTTVQKDSLFFQLGYNYYYLRSVDTSARYLSRISQEFPNFYKAKFYEAFNYLYAGNYDLSEKTLAVIEQSGDTNLLKVKNLYLAGISLLQYDYVRFNNYSKSFHYDYYPIKNEEKNMMESYNNLLKNKKRSMFLAGLLSAVLPGSGKYYAGYRGQALGAFVPVAVAGTIAAENLLKEGGGLKSPGFIIFGGLFAVFYTGNIWGSAVSVKVQRQERYNEIKNNILLDLHIPLRHIFN